MHSLGDTSPHAQQMLRRLRSAMLIGRVIRPTLVGLGLLALSAGTAAAQTAGKVSLESQQALVGKYCTGCHNDRRPAGGFSWSKIDLANPAASPEASEKVIRRLRAGLMPPMGAPRPDAAASLALASSMESAIDRAAAARPYAGAPELHRVNRTEYRNSIRDLLGLDVDVSSLLPPDEMSRGFDNISNALAVTPALVQGYVRAAGRISREAIGDAEVAPAMATGGPARRSSSSSTSRPCPTSRTTSRCCRPRVAAR